MKHNKKNTDKANHYKKSLICLLASGILMFSEATLMKAQQVPRYSQYFMNEFLINPAAAGADGMTLVNLTGRAEWVGFENNVPTPQTYTINVQSRLLKRSSEVKSTRWGNKLTSSRNGRVGLGAGLINDYNGAFQRIGIHGTYAYHIYMNRSQLSFGLTGSITQLSIRDKYIEFKEPDDRMSTLTNTSIWIPDFAAGVNFMTLKFHIGFSAVQLLESKLSFGDTELKLSSTSVNYNRNYYLLTSYLDNINEDWQFESSVIIKTNDKFSAGLKVQGDLVLRLIYNKAVWFGAGYRTSNDAIVLFGIKHNRLYATYSFDYGSNGMAMNSYGSHELSLTLKYGSSQRRFPWMDRY